MLIALLRYTRPLEEVDALLPEHRAYLEKLFTQNKLLLCGRLQPRTGGVIISRNISRGEFETILQSDPFGTICQYEIIEFVPTLYADSLQNLIRGEL